MGFGGVIWGGIKCRREAKSKREDVSMIAQASTVNIVRVRPFIPREFLRLVARQ